MKKDEWIDLFLSFFPGREDTYALWFESKSGGKGYYVPSTYADEREDKKWLLDAVEHVTTKIGTKDYNRLAVKAHLYGDQFLGVYPIFSDSTVHWFALDFDAESPEGAWEEALAQQKIFQKEAGLPTYIERSRSGNGFHLWGFLDGRVNAGILRHALSQFIADVDTYDRMFPNQGSVYEARPLGNLIALPLFGPNVARGNGAFVYAGAKGEPSPFADQQNFLANDVVRIPVGHIEELARNHAEKYEPEKEVQRRQGGAGELQGSFKMTNPKFGCEFIQWCKENPNDVSEPEWYCLACQFAQFEDGRELFHEWSEGYDKYDEQETDLKFDQAVLKNAPHSCEYIRKAGFGEGCYCDKRFDGVYHPFDLYKIPLSQLIDSVSTEARVKDARDGLLDALDRAHRYHDDPTTGKGLSYGISSLDEYTGARDGELICICGRPGSGKSAFTMDIAYRWANEGMPIFYFSMEMDSSQVEDRLLARVADVDSRRILTGTMTKKDWKAIKKAANRVARDDGFNFLIDEVTLDATELIDQVGTLMSQYGKGVVFVDYLQLTKPESGEGDRERTARAVSMYRLLAKHVNIPVICAVQLNRSADDITSDSKAYYSMIKESGQIEQDAHVIMFLLTDQENSATLDTRTIVGVKERRMGGGWKVKVQYNKGTSHFADMGTWAADSSQRHKDTSQFDEIEHVKSVLGITTEELEEEIVDD